MTVAKIYSPEHHILIAEVYSNNGINYLRVKKRGKDVYEDIPLDLFVQLVLSSVYHKAA